MHHLRSGVVLMLAAVIGMSAVTAAPSSASFTDRSSSTATVSAAVDWVPPTVSLQPLPSPASGAVTIGVQASDAESSVAQVSMQVRSAGASSWTPLCTDTTAPFACSWDTRTLTDGQYEVRARAVDAYDNVSGWVSAPVTVSNRAQLVVTAPADTVRGTARITAAWTGDSPSVLWQGIQVRRAGSGGWSDLCWGYRDTVTCDWQTTNQADGGYELRAWSMDSWWRTTYSEPVRLDVDNTAPTVTMVDPGRPLKGVRTFRATADDALSGVASVTIYAYSSRTGSVQALCTMNSAPWSCAYDTDRLPNGSIAFFAQATDRVGNTGTSAWTSSRVDQSATAMSARATTPEPVPSTHEGTQPTPVLEHVDPAEPEPTQAPASSGDAVDTTDREPTQEAAGEAEGDAPPEDGQGADEALPVEGAGAAEVSP